MTREVCLSTGIVQRSGWQGLANFGIGTLAPREHVRIDRRPGQRQGGSRAQALAIVADDARAQRQPARLADHQDGIAVVDDVVDHEVDGIVGAAGLAGRPQPQAFRPDHDIDVARRERRLPGPRTKG